MALLWALLLLTGCFTGRDAEPGPPTVDTHDLVAELAFADTQQEAGPVRPGEPPGRPFLGIGWSGAEKDPSGEPFAWGTGERSTLELPILARRDVVIVLDGRPWQPPGTEAQVVTVELGSTHLGEITLSEKRSEHRIEVPKEALRLGRNRIRLSYRRWRSPDAAGSDRRRPAVAWYRIGFEDPLPTSPLRVEPESSRLFLAYGTQVDLHLRLEEQSELWAEAWTFRGAGRLVLSTRRDDGSEVRIVLEGAPEQGRAPLAASGITRLSLLPIAAEPEGSKNGGIVLTRPRIRGRRPGPSTAETPGTHESSPEPELAPNVVFFLIDTLRADRLGVYGNRDGLTPEIDAFAGNAVVFERAYAQSSWTRASIASIFTGLWPPAHGTNQRDKVLSGDARLLPAVLREYGFQTAAFVSNPNISPTFGFDRGFDHYDLIGTGTDGVRVTAEAIDWLRNRRDREDPYFLLLLTTDPHSPYAPPADLRQRFAPSVPSWWEPDSKNLGKWARRWTRSSRRDGKNDVTVDDALALYDAEVAFNDRAFGELLQVLDSLESDRETVIFLSSDHGEEFLEHGQVEHGKTLFAESIHIPLIVRKGRNGASGRVDVPVQHIDWFPTLLDLVGAEIPAGLAGRSLAPWLTTDPAAPRDTWPEERPIYTYLHLDGRPRAAVQVGRWKLIQLLAGETMIRPRLFDLAEDPGETRNLAGELPIRAGYLRALLRARLANRDHHLDVQSTAIDDELRRTLEALGYL